MAQRRMVFFSSWHYRGFDRQYKSTQVLDFDANRDEQLDTICIRLKMRATDGRQSLTDCANVEGVFHIIMSVPSPKAETLKLWLAEQGKRAIDEAT